MREDSADTNAERMPASVDASTASTKFGRREDADLTGTTPTDAETMGISEDAITQSRRGFERCGELSWETMAGDVARWSCVEDAADTNNNTNAETDAIAQTARQQTEVERLGESPEDTKSLEN